MKTILLAGGLGTRLSEETVIRPKPMLEIDERPMLWHIMNIYGAHGFNDFVVAAGYKAEFIKAYFYTYRQFDGDLVIDLKSGKTDVHNSKAPDWRVTVLDTGLQTQPGDRVKRRLPHLDNKTFMMTYGDGVGNIDITLASSPQIIQGSRPSTRLERRMAMIRLPRSWPHSRSNRPSI
jgi:glucose-1-phosphate cytidylyltransferase